MNLVLKLQGYPDSHEVIPIDTVSAEIIGPHEATRYIGKESTDAINITGPIVIARSVLQRPVFGTSERSYKYHDGMIGQAEVSVRSERMILSLIPGLRELLRSPRETLFRSE